LEGKRAIVTVASGGTEAGSERGFVTGCMRQVPGLIGVADVSFATADRIVLGAAASLAAAEAKVRALTA
jgi:FMN-dependent NADH-azoreductase